MFLVDSHCHLDALDYEMLHLSIDDVLEKAAQQHVKFCLAVSTSLQGFQKFAPKVKENNSIALTCGVHPLNLDEGFDVSLFERLAADPHVVGLGETGLDYYYDRGNKHAQQAAFIQHIQVGRLLKKPLVVHTREAKIDTLQLLKAHKADECQGVLHCFTEDKVMAKKLLDLGFYISFSGIVTFKNAKALQDVARYVPLERILIETDSPYLAPVPYRGKENQPAYVREVANCLAELKKIELSELATITTANFSRLFNIHRLKQEKK